MAVRPIPEGYHTVTPYLYLRNAAAALDFYKKAFGAKEVVRLPGPGGKIMHAEIQIGNSMIMMADEHPEIGAKSPDTLGGASCGLALYVEDADALFKQALAAGAKEQRPMKDQFYGDRSGTVTDPFGHTWTIGTHKEDVSPEEMNRRFNEMMKQK